MYKRQLHTGSLSQRICLEVLADAPCFEAHLDAALAEVAQPGVVSYLAITAYCFLTHLGFRQVASIEHLPRLSAFCQEFGARPSALATPYHFD